MDKYLAVKLWWAIITLQFILLVIEVLFFEMWHPIWLLIGVLIYSAGMFLPMGDKDIKNKYGS